MKLVVLFAFFAASFALPIPYDRQDRQLYGKEEYGSSLAKTYFEILPDEVKQFYNKLTPADVQLLKQYSYKLRGKNDTEAYNYMKIYTLSPPARQYFKEVIRNFQNMDPNGEQGFVNCVEQTFAAARQVPWNVQREIVRAYPTLKGLFWGQY
ncbi:hypothetical protein L596_023285 [Steinernema carpocapsae]|uniref:SXP/RAL-2 family protein Ani s 5-like cation-binding domain-containing protein n=1 Tax=Steinernema carpocapsae TaxID=34508 RepID=A0A4U5MD70_STECR|nr:hypothetical protein L596_023285 [Steinernema carpocapsae]